jgi:uncharacterized protein YbjQ (UPF0145 family)
VLVVTTDSVPGYDLTDVLGEVLGVVACSRNPFEAGLKSPDGGGGAEVPHVLVQTRKQAIAQMVHAAEHRGANAVVGMRFDHRDITNHWVELCAYGTAVVATASAAVRAARLRSDDGADDGAGGHHLAD